MPQKQIFFYFFGKGEHNFYYAKIIVWDDVKSLLPEVNRIKVKRFVINYATVNKIAFWLQYKILITYNSTYCQIATDERTEDIANDYFLII
jgi:hypothetical protein